jgi:hypothetical protein
MTYRYLIATLLLCSCDFREPVGPQPNPSACADACATLARLGCESAKPTDAGESCEQVCRTVEESGTITSCPAQVVRARTCEEAETLSQCAE